MRRFILVLISGAVLLPLGMLLAVSLVLLSAEQALDRSEIRYIQSVLCCPSTGVLDANTRQALLSYQRINMLAANPVLDRSLTTRLLQETPCKPGFRSYYENTLTRMRIIQLQHKLQVEPSGTLDGWTRRALTAFQNRQGLAQRMGVVTPSLLQRISKADRIQNTPAAPLYGLGIPIAEGDKSWVRVNHFSRASRYPVGTRLTVTSLGVERRSVEVEVQGRFREGNPRKILQISRQASKLLHLGERKEVAVMIEESH